MTPVPFRSFRLKTVPDTFPPVSLKDILPQYNACQEIDPATVISDRPGRPISISGEGKVRRETLA